MWPRTFKRSIAREDMNSKVKVAIIRGWFLNPWEMMRYEPLAKEFDLRAIGTYRSLFDVSGIGIRVTKLHWPGECFYTFGKNPAQLINRGLYKYVRYNQWLFGLEHAVRNFDILHAADTSHLFSLQAARIKKKHGNKLVLTVWENIPFQDARRRVYRSISREVVQHTDIFLPVTQKSKDMLLVQGVPEAKIVVIPQPVDLQRFAPKPTGSSVRVALGCSTEDFVVMFIGRLHRSKGLEFLLEAVKRLLLDRSMRSPLKLVVVGAGERERIYKELAVRLGVGQHVIWCGAVKHHDLPDYYAAADVFVLPSIPTDEWQEQFGMVLVEAMACGKPVISTLSGSIPDVVGQAGMLVQPADHSALAHAIRQFVVNPRMCEYYGRLARNHVTTTYAPEIVAAMTADVYRELARR
jgi:glycosyltransferase involved in cell wall biosynthesis